MENRRKPAPPAATLDINCDCKEFILDSLSVCDLYLLVFLTWRGSPSVAGKLPEFAALDTFYQRLFVRPALAQVLSDEMRMLATHSPYSKAP